MKTKLISVLLSAVLIIFALIIQGCFYTTVQSQNDENGSNSDSTQNQYDNYSEYYDSGNYDQVLSDYGTWIMISPYGNVWKPFVPATWEPYYYGHWVYTQYGWTWVSYEPFGWIVYHYGFWDYNQFYGWIWIPADDPWAPARVEWLDYGDYVAWAPLPPAGISYGDPWTEHSSVWRIASSENLTRNDVSNYYVSPSSLRNDIGDRNSYTRHAPKLNHISDKIPGGVQEVKIDRQEIKSRTRKVERMKLPKAQVNIIRNHIPEIQQRGIELKNSSIKKRNNWQQNEKQHEQRQPQKKNKTRNENGRR